MLKVVIPQGGHYSGSPGGHVVYLALGDPCMPLTNTQKKDLLHELEGLILVTKETLGSWHLEAGKITQGIPRVPLRASGTKRKGW